MTTVGWVSEPVFKGFYLNGQNPPITTTDQHPHWIVPSTGDRNLQVLWYLKYNIKWVDWDGTVLKEEWVEYKANATPPSNPTRTGYTFTG
jgi:hypothetical protein